MKIRKLTDTELLTVYGEYSPLYFPSEELKPLSTVEWLLEKQIYLAYGCYADGQLLAYACLIRVPGQETLLLDYYAVLEQYRSSGIGGIFLELLAKELESFGGIYIESEDPAYAQDPADRQLRERRIAFYLRNQAVSTGISSCLFGVNYSILFLPCSLKERQPPYWHAGHLDDIYQNMFPPKHYQTKVRIIK